MTLRRVLALAVAALMLVAVCAQDINFDSQEQLDALQAGRNNQMREPIRAVPTIAELNSELGHANKYLTYLSDLRLKVSRGEPVRLGGAEAAKQPTLKEVDEERESVRQYIAFLQNAVSKLRAGQSIDSIEPQQPPARQIPRSSAVLSDRQLERESERASQALKAMLVGLESDGYTMLEADPTEFSRQQFGWGGYPGFGFGRWGGFGFPGWGGGFGRWGGWGGRWGGWGGRGGWGRWIDTPRFETLATMAEREADSQAERLFRTEQAAVLPYSYPALAYPAVSPVQQAPIMTQPVMTSPVMTSPVLQQQPLSWGASPWSTATEPIVGGEPLDVMQYGGRYGGRWGMGERDRFGRDERFGGRFGRDERFGGRFGRDDRFGRDERFGGRFGTPVVGDRFGRDFGRFAEEEQLPLFEQTQYGAPQFATPVATPVTPISYGYGATPIAQQPIAQQPFTQPIVM